MLSVVSQPQQNVTPIYSFIYNIPSAPGQLDHSSAKETIDTSTLPVTADLDPNFTVSFGNMT